MIINPENISLEKLQVNSISQKDSSFKELKPKDPIRITIT